MYGNDIAAISARLKELRTFSDYTTAQVAEMLGVDEEEYVAYESGTKEIPINLIYKFADVMETEAAYVMSGVLPSKDKVYVVYDGKGMSVKRYEGYSFTSLGGDFRKKTMNPMLVTIAPTDTPELVVHGGQEFNYVLEGELRVIVDNRDYFLRAGDSIYFDPSFPHAQLAMGGRVARFLTVRIALSEPLSWCSRTSVYAPLPDSGSFAHFIEISPSVLTATFGAQLCQHPSFGSLRTI